jgi:haloalkane dehalogenase
MDLTFRSAWFETSAGRLHYLDSGIGDPVLFVHGNPSSSYEFRHVMADLHEERRLVAPDLIGFGQSDKPSDWDYLPSQHAATLEALVLSLDLKAITLVVSDWGGPIGLSVAIRHPDRFRALVITNSWAWPVDNDPHFSSFSSLMGGAVGRWLTRHFNFFAAVVVRRGFANPSKLTSQVAATYRRPFAKPDDRKGCWTFPQQIVAATPWLAELERGLKRLNGKPVALCWGEKDVAFREKELKHWLTIYPWASLVRLPECGHFVAEEDPQTVADAVRTVVGLN